MGSNPISPPVLDDEALVRAAESCLRPYTTREGRLIGDVAAAVLTEKGDVHVGTCVDVPGWGLCAERSALAAMITAGEYRFRRIVAVWRDPVDGRLLALPPCGICREFMRAIDGANLDATVIVGPGERVTLRELLPRNAWPARPLR